MKKRSKSLYWTISTLVSVYPELVLAIYLIATILFCLYIICTDKKLGYYIPEKIQVEFMKFALRTMIDFLVGNFIGQEVMDVIDFVIWLYNIVVCFKHQYDSKRYYNSIPYFNPTCHSQAEMEPCG